MKRGDWLVIRAYPNKELERILWKEFNTYVLVCRPEVYSDAIKGNKEPLSCMGFPKEDVVHVRKLNPTGSGTH